MNHHHITAWLPRGFAVIAGALLLGATSACQAPKTWVPDENASPGQTMVLAPGDEVEVTFMGAPELDMTQTIRRDGYISLRLIGQVKAGGKTPGELEADLRELYKPQLEKREITVVARSTSPVYVMGSVLSPGAFPMNRFLTALDAVVAAGGFDAYSAEVRSVVVVRQTPEGRKGYLLDFKDTLAGGHNQPFYLQPFDVVYVPRTRISKIDQWVDQHITQLLPFGISYDTSDGSTTLYR
jgi:protein involved in polysaccharide export with SLBB domain